MERPIRLRFKIPMTSGEVLIIDESKSDAFLEIVLDENDHVKVGRYVLVSKFQPRIRKEKNLEFQKVKKSIWQKLLGK